MKPWNHVNGEKIHLKWDFTVGVCWSYQEVKLGWNSHELAIIASHVFLGGLFLAGFADKVVRTEDPREIHPPVTFSSPLSPLDMWLSPMR